MARGFAHVSLVGNLAADPELRQTPSGRSVCQLRVAVGSPYKDANGQWVDKTSFFDVIVWGPQAESCARFLSRGRQVAVDGRLDQRSWEGQDGTKRSKVQIVANTVVFLGAPGAAGQDVGGASVSSRASDITAVSDMVPVNDFKDIDFGEEDDDIPF